MKGNDKRGGKKKIPGMVYIAFSFAPWILYFVVCGFGDKTGIVVALALSLILVIPQAAKKSFSMMDVTSTLYFGVAFVATSIFGLNVFVEKDGLLGYTALLLMSFFSLVAKQPFTLQVSKRDYPEVYWKDKSFIAINSLIMVVWTVVFGVNAVIFLLLSRPLTIILPNTLIGVGVAFSIIFPLKAPVRMMTKELRKYDWRVDVDPEKPKGEDEYDVIVVGSGIGGLTCGALLSKRGYKVLVLEQHYQVGGYCSSFERKGFTFNTGVEDVSGVWENGPIAFLLDELGLKKDELFVRNTTRYIFKGRSIDIPNSVEKFTKLLSEMFPGEKRSISNFFKEAKEAYDECYKEVPLYGTPLTAALIAKVLGERKLLAYPLERPHFYDWMQKTFKQKLDEHFKNEDIETFLSSLLGYVGTTPEKTPASSALVACVAYYLHGGGFFPKGGAQHFANTLSSYIENHGGKVLVKHKADRILVEKGKIRGVKVGDKVSRSPIVVANANAKTTFLELIGEANLNKKFVDYIKGLRMSPACFLVFLGVDMDLSKLTTLNKNVDEGYEIVFNSNADPSLAPQGKASVTLLTSANYHDSPERGTKEYQQKKREFAEALIRKAEKVIPGLDKHIIVLDAATPKTFERYTFMPEGAIYSFDQSSETKRPYFKTPIKGLYLASSSTFPGGGIEAVAISGTICANDICNWKIESQWTDTQHTFGLA
nr:NAD(P)/FAD-dependent oxidoreductase [Candidatus Njordarchaeota archaeon]